MTDLEKSGYRTACEQADYSSALKQLQGLVPLLESFFEGVMVMDKDSAVKENRCRLLAMVQALGRCIGPLALLPVSVEDANA